MRVTALIRYDAAVDDVIAMLCDQEFQDRKLRETGALSWSAEVAGAPGTSAPVVITTRRELPTDLVPDPFRAAVGASLTIEQVETWQPGPQGGYCGSIDVQVQGAPIRLRGTMLLSAAGTGSTQQVDGELKAKVPLFGGRIETAVEPAVRAAIEAEERIGQDWLATRNRTV